MKDFIFLVGFDAICFLLTIYFRSKLIKLKVNFENEGYFCFLSVIIPMIGTAVNFNQSNKILSIILGVFFWILTFINYIVARDYDAYKEYKNKKDKGEN